MHYDEKKLQPIISWAKSRLKKSYNPRDYIVGLLGADEEGGPTVHLELDRNHTVSGSSETADWDNPEIY